MNPTGKHTLFLPWKLEEQSLYPVPQETANIYTAAASFGLHVQYFSF